MEAGLYCLLKDIRRILGIGTHATIEGRIAFMLIKASRQESQE